MTIKGFALMALLVGAVTALPDADKVNTLYQWPDISFGLYSGYVPIPNTEKQLHYITALSQRNWQQDPVIIWFNGGPGCSSMLGFLQEHGPYALEDGASEFTKNPYSWNKEATMIYIESPAGVGYSLCPKLEECQYDDFNSAEDNLQAFVQLMQKFPELQKNDLYISGESYAGIYVPRLVERIDWYIGNCTANKSCPFIPNLKGFIVGNGVTDYRFDNSNAYVEMAFWYGLIATETYNGIKANCMGETPADICKQLFAELESATQNINVYDAFGICWKPQAFQEKYGPMESLIRSGNSIKAMKRSYQASDLTPFLNDKNFNKFGKHLKLIPPCVFAKPLLDYMNNATVRTQLNIPVSAPAWDLCNGTMNENYKRGEQGSIDVYESLKGKYKMLKYSGDTDMAVPTYGTRDWIDNLNWPIVNNWKQFFVDGQVGGYVETRQDGKFVFATIHGAGHMAPQWRRGPSYRVVFNFINNKPLN